MDGVVRGCSRTGDIIVARRVADPKLDWAEGTARDGRPFGGENIWLRRETTSGLADSRTLVRFEGVYGV